MKDWKRKKLKIVLNVKRKENTMTQVRLCALALALYPVKLVN